MFNQQFNFKSCETIKTTFLTINGIYRIIVKCKSNLLFYKNEKKKKKILTKELFLFFVSRIIFLKKWHLKKTKKPV